MKKFFYLLIISVIFLSVQINIVPLMASSPGTSPSLIQNDSCDGRNPCSGSCTDEGDNGTYEGTCGLLGVQNPVCICIPNEPEGCDGRDPCSGSCTGEGDNGTYEGTCGLLGVQNPACICIPNDPTPSPTPAQKPQPPILIKTK